MAAIFVSICGGNTDKPLCTVTHATHSYGGGSGRGSGKFSTVAEAIRVGIMTRLEMEALLCVLLCITPGVLLTSKQGEWVFLFLLSATAPIQAMQPTLHPQAEFPDINSISSSSSSSFKVSLHWYSSEKGELVNEKTAFPIMITK